MTNLTYRVVVGALLLFQWHPHAKPLPPVEDRRTQVRLPNECITKISTGPRTNCIGPDLAHLSCANLVITYKVGCEQVEVVHEPVSRASE